MSRYTDWTSGEPIEKEWPMTPDDPALRARLRWLSDEAPKLWWQPENRGDTSKSAHLEVRAIADDALAALAAAAEAAPLDVERLAEAIWTAETGDYLQYADPVEARRFAADIAREYAALRSPDTETAGEAG